MSVISLPCHWWWGDFDALSPMRLYALLRLRAEVFVVEQACAFQDIDGLDPQALHVCGEQAGDLLAYARVFAPGVLEPRAIIGRVVSAPARRGQGLGRALMQEVLRGILARWPQATIYLGAQQRLQAFYEGFGFVVAGEPYLEDGIWHVGMQAEAAQLAAPD